jgi:hypothetical protein
LIGVAETLGPRSLTMFARRGARSFGALWWVRTAMTPGMAAAAALSMPVIRARATVE